MQAPELTRGKVIHIAWPIILSNISTPLLGLVDTAVIGNLGDASLLGAIAVGAVIFSFLYWGFGFLRMGTTALVAQATGAKQDSEASAVFYRAALLGAGIGLLLLLLQSPIAALCLNLLNGSAAVESSAKLYFEARIFGAPFSLSLLAVMGYLLGIQKTKVVLLLNLLLNGTNILLDLIFVLVLDWGVEGVAYATVIAEITTMLVGCGVVLKSTQLPAFNQLKDLTQVKRMFTVNRDILIRTLCLIFAFAWFTDQGASQGDVTLASNAILMQFVTFSAFFLDGFALSAETLIGAAVGAQDYEKVVLSIRYVFELGVATATALALFIWLSGPSVIRLLTNVESVRHMTDIYLVWAIFAPLVSVWCYVFDGIFIGATRTVEMRNAMIFSLLAFLLLWWVAFPLWLNHGLWLSLYGYFIARAVSLGWYVRPMLTELEELRDLR